MYQRFGAKHWHGRPATAGGFGRLPGAFPTRLGSRRTGITFEPLPHPGALIVDLRRNFLSPEWWRGAATLALLIGGAAWLAPARPMVDGSDPMSAEAMRQSEADGVGALADGSPAGIAMAPDDRVDPLIVAPERVQVDFTSRLSRGDSVGHMLARSGAKVADAIEVDRLVRGAVPGGVMAGTAVTVRLGRRLGDGSRPVQTVALRAALDTRLLIRASGAALALIRVAVPVDARPLRIRGRVGDGLYWSLRSAGVSPRLASDYLRALAREMDVGGDQVMPSDAFELVADQRRAATGEVEIGALQYAGFGHGGARPLRLVWIANSANSAGNWVDAAALDAPRAQSSAMIWPVSARITSTFGLRFHPILHYARMHRGIDFGAHFGSPVVATADGVVARASWAGGYGQQVGINHAGGLASSYSHLSRMLVTPGTVVHRGQLIAYSGSTGLSTGPHLHYEVTRGGVAVNPMSVTFAASSFDAGLAAKVKARLKALLG